MYNFPPKLCFPLNFFPIEFYWLNLKLVIKKDAYSGLNLIDEILLLFCTTAQQ